MPLHREMEGAFFTFKSEAGIQLGVVTLWNLY